MIPGGLICAVQQPPSITSSPCIQRVVSITTSSDNYLIWSVEDVRYLRNELGVVGNLCGALPRQPRQNREYGLPLCILKEEAVLLVSMGRGKLIKSDNQDHVVDEDAYKSSLKGSFEVQNEYLLQHIYQKSQKFVDKPVKEPPHLNLSGIVDLTNPAHHLHKMFEKETDATLWNVNYKEIPLTDIKLSEKEKMRLFVYQDLRKRGYMITPGTRFGGDFLAYPGDPFMYHAYFVVKVQQAETELGVAEMLTLARLASSVRKVAVLAGVSEDRVSYISLQWSGLG